MAKELPYFRFTSQEWQNGLISLESYHIKGLFIDVCAYYWVQDCSITRAMLGKKFKNDKKELNELVELGILKVNKKDEIIITYLDDQLDMLSNKRKLKQLAGSKGGKQKSSNAKAQLQHSSSYKDKDKDKDNKGIPLLSDFIEHALDKKPNLCLESISLKYESWVDGGWATGHDKPIKNWKRTLTNTIPYLKEVKKKSILVEHIENQINNNK